MRAQLERLGMTSEELEPKQVETVLALLEKGLRVFVGSPKAASLIAEVRAALLEEERR